MDDGASAILHDVVLDLEERASDPVASGELDGDTVTRMLGAAIRVYVRRLENGERLGPLPVPPIVAPSATEVMVVVTQLLAACQIELFELGMWQTWGAVQLGAPEPDGESEAA